MTLPPVVDRELRVASRRPATHRVRFFSALGVMALWILLLGMNRSATAASLSQLIFVIFGSIALGFAMLAGVFLTADCLSEEQREETLGLLFLTDLKGYDVVLGKLAATSLQASYGLIAVFPLLALPVLMGGVSGTAFWRLVVVLLVTLFLSLSLGMVVSALNREARQSMAGTFGAMVLLAGVFPAFYWFQILIFRRAWAPWVLLPSPVFAFVQSLDSYTFSRTRWNLFLVSLAVLAGIGLLSLAGAAFLLPRAWRSGFRAKARDRSPPGPAAASGSVHRVMEARALRTWSPGYWLALRGPGVGRLGAALLVVVLGIWATFLAICLSGRNAQNGFAGILFTGAGLHILMKVFLSVECTRHLSEARQSGALELLLTTPLSEREILEGQFRAILRKFWGWWLVLCLVNIFMAGAVTVFSIRLGMRWQEQFTFMEILIGGIFAALADLPTITLVGMWQALRTNRHHRAVLATIGRVLLPSWGAIFVIIFFMSTSRGVSETEVDAIFALWFVFGLGVDAVMGGTAYGWLRRGFRRILKEGSWIGTRCP